MKDKKIMFYECDFDNAEVCIESTGEWIRLADFSDWNELVEACGGEDNLRFSDYHDIPTALIGETWIADGIYEIISAISQSEHSAALMVYLDYYVPPFSYPEHGQWTENRIRRFGDEFIGDFTDEANFAEVHYVLMGKVSIHDDMYKYIDWERVGFDLFVNDFLFIKTGEWNNFDGYVYRRR